MNKELSDDAKSPSASSTATSEGRFCIKDVIEEEEEDVGKGALSLGSKVHASACKGMLLRHGVGTLEHLSLKCLWVQEAHRDERIQVVIPRDANAADVLAYASGVCHGLRQAHQPSTVELGVDFFGF